MREAAVWYDASADAIAEVDRADRIERLARIRRILLGLLTHLRKQTAKAVDRW